MRTIGSVLWPKFRVLQIYGANTGVGKTIFSSILCRAFRKKLQNVKYLKPISTGPLEEADDHHNKSFNGNIVDSKCLFQFDDPVSPHLAARAMGKNLPDAEVQAAIYDELKSYVTGQQGIAILETAGGVLSPSPSGSSQADLYRPLHLPSLLVGDHRLGGIATTISAWESLHVRGYDVPAIALFAGQRYQNYEYLKDYFHDRQVATFAVDEPPERQTSAEADREAMQEYYQKTSEHADVEAFTESFLDAHEQRIQDLRVMSEVANEAIWHPFMQHTERSKDTITAWDSAYGDHFQAYRTAHEAELRPDGNASLLKPAFDGSASWWTQGLGHGNPKLALTAAHAAGRYGHVMFANAVHQPALDLATTVINKSGNSRLAKVFYSDNGSTGMEVAVKMALRATVERYKPEDRRKLDIRIVGLKNSYHGDTIGTMDCSEPSIYNEKVEWYRGRGIWLDFPTVKMRQGQWQVEPVDSTGQTRHFESLNSIFDFDQRQQDAEIYKKHIHETLLERVQKEGASLGALVIEPIILGAGGMLFADPLFQKCLVEVARGFYNQSFEPVSSVSSGKNNSDALEWQGMPVIFDEVFTGLYRLGRFSAASFLDVKPDIVVNAKLLTGGLLPLCTTTASNSIFEAFLSNDKTDALLHGHSYTAHPVGCAVANESLRTFEQLDAGGAWDNFRQDWTPPTSTQPADSSASGEHAWSMWSNIFVSTASHRDSVDHVFALGSVVAICLKDPSGGGYASTAATGLRDQLLEVPGADGAVMHSRVMGNVLYLMAALTTTEATLRGIEQTVLSALK
ncbi:putative aminotransferase class-III, pyridoxal phosphate-dependent transferase, major [Septoria linicola]|nr:putative aminotransferase class-III, pyridoxal phosphate-dependent transferase, major [Septoria linicola]